MVGWFVISLIYKPTKNAKLLQLKPLLEGGGRVVGHIMMGKGTVKRQRV